MTGFSESGLCQSDGEESPPSPVSARAREACACVCEWVLCLSVHCRVGGGIVSQGMCARQLRVCVCDTDGCANGKTDRCLGGSNGMQWWSGAHSRGEIRVKTSSIGGESPITKSFHWARCAKEERPDSPVYPRSNMGRKAAEVWFPRRIRRRKLFLRPLTGVRDEAQQHHIWRKGRQEDRGRRPLATHPYCSPCSSRTLCFHPRFRLGLPEKNKTPENFIFYFLSTSPTQSKNFYSSL